MISNTSYKSKTVHDIPVGKGFVRLWNVDGAVDEKLIIKTFRPLLKTSFIDPYIALMPDFHESGNTMVGSVIPTKDVILPLVIGDDIGCGMLALMLPLSFHDLKDPKGILEDLKVTIPAGMEQHRDATGRFMHNRLWKTNEKPAFIKGRDWGKIYRQFATLGGGNHFVEVLEDDEKKLWLIIHSGSRYLGSLIKKHYVMAGEKDSNIDPVLYRKIPHIKKESSNFYKYLKDHDFAAAYAKESRFEMMLCVLKLISYRCQKIKESDFDAVVNDRIDVSHNAISQENHFGQSLLVHRKGSIHLPKGRRCVIPGSMGTCSFIVEGRGNNFSFFSASHGAGRSMSRGKAFSQIKTEAFRKSMKGIFYDDNVQSKDEAPHAYKDIRAVMRGQKDLVKILKELRPVLSYKGK